jgi:hypothetical protein
MKLVHAIPPLEPAWPTLLAYYCEPCCHAETVRDEHSLERLVLFALDGEPRSTG